MRAALAAAPTLLVACTGIVDAGADAAAGGGASDAGATASGFAYPVGDLATAPAGGWVVTQVLSHYYAAWGGRHLAQDLGHPDGGLAAIGAPVHAIGPGVVRYAGPNSSTYLNVVLIEHDLGAEGIVCSFYGHMNAPMVATGDTVERGQQISTVADWAVAGGGDSANSHLHYVVLSSDLCAASAAAGGALVCGYDEGGESSAVDLSTEPSRYTSAGDVCGTQQYPDAFLSPSQFIAAHR